MNKLKTLGISATACFIAATVASTRAADSPVVNDDAAAKAPVINDPVIWKDASQPVDARVHDLVRRMSLLEKVSQLRCDPVGISRLGLPAYSHRNECLHGIANGTATVFPQAIGMAATWDLPLVHDEADAIATEARAKHNDYVAKHNGDSAHRFGLSFYTPNINIFRDPRWGRGQETYGEDPFLTGQTGVAFICGLQGDDPKYFKIIACAKHFVAHSGPEPERHTLDVKPTDRDLYETYLPAFEAAVREGHVASVMGAYSSLYGVPDCANAFLLTDVLRKQWGFDGFVVSDGGAIWDIWAQHKYASTPEEAAADAVKAGCDLASGNIPVSDRDPALRRSVDWTADANGWLRGGTDFDALTQAVQKHLILESEIDTALGRELTARFRLGMFDPPSMVPYSKIGIDQNDTPEHRALAEKVAQESIVLLKNDGLLPLDRGKFRHISVFGANANSTEMLQASYHGTPSHAVTILDGIRTIAGANVDVTFQKGFPLAFKKDNSNAPTAEALNQAVATAKSADLIIYVGGLDSTLEAEESNSPKLTFDGFNRGDRTRIELPTVQEDLLKALFATGKPVVFVNCSGSAIAMPWEAEHLPAIVQAWYPGEQGGRAVAQVLFGDINPAGRLPVTFYASTSDLPPFDDYSMANRTYRYFSGKPLFSFGHGLSYTKFDYGDAKLEGANVGADETIKLSFTVKNIGPRDGDEVAQVYFRLVHSAMPQAQLALCGFTRVHLAQGATTNVSLDIPAKRMRYWDSPKQSYVVEPGDYELLIGGASDDIRQRARLKIVATQ